MQTIDQNGLSIATTKAGLIAGTTSTLTIANAMVYSIFGKCYSKGATSNIVTPTTDATTGLAFKPIPAGAISSTNVVTAYGSVFSIGLDSGGNLKVSQGDIKQLDTAGSGFVDAPQLPELPDTVCPIGYLVVKGASNNAAWTFGTSNLTGPPTGITLAWQDTIGLPYRPQVA